MTGKVYFDIFSEILDNSFQNSRIKEQTTINIYHVWDILSLAKFGPVYAGVVSYDESRNQLTILSRIQRAQEQTPIYTSCRSLDMLSLDEFGPVFTGIVYSDISWNKLTILSRIQRAQEQTTIYLSCRRHVILRWFWSRFYWHSL